MHISRSHLPAVSEAVAVTDGSGKDEQVWPALSRKRLAIPRVLPASSRPAAQAGWAPGTVPPGGLRWRLRRSILGLDRFASEDVESSAPAALQKLDDASGDLAESRQFLATEAAIDSYQ
jgi:hypothetical protein